MICCKCGKEIDKQYAPDWCNGVYCEKCAKGFYSEAEKGFAEACEKSRKAGEELAKSLSEGICKVLNGIPVEKHEEEKPKIDRCEGCIHRSEYQDMGATTPICRKGYDLAEAAKMRLEQTPCKYKVTWREIDEYTKRRNEEAKQDDKYEDFVECPHCHKWRYSMKGIEKLSCTCGYCGRELYFERCENV